MSKDVEDAFSDFEEKVHNKPKKKLNFLKKEEKEQTPSEEELIKQRFQEEKDALKEKYRKEMAAAHHKKTKQAIKEGKLPPHSQFKVERIAYIAIIILLVMYVVIDLSFYHGSTEVVHIENQGTTQNAANVDAEETETESEKEKVEETESSESEEEESETEPEEEKEEPKEEKEETVTRSGRVDFIINNIETELVDDDLGYIKRVTFTIQNDKDTTLTPVVNVFAYDDKLKDIWEKRSRGTYTYPAGISPGKYVEGSVVLSPKTFRNLNLEKTVRIELNDTKIGFIKSDDKEIDIE